MAGKKKIQGFTWAQATRDIVLRLIATGQLPVGILGGAVLLMVFKTPDSAMPQVWATAALFIKARAGLGYLLGTAAGGGWFFHARFQRKNAERELRRLSRIRTDQQQPYFRGRLESSED